MSKRRCDSSLSTSDAGASPIQWLRGKQFADILNRAFAVISLCEMAGDFA